jgi:carbon storage regulator
MLVLTRKSHEQIQIGDNITITILRVKGGAIRVGIDAPKNLSVLRKELVGKPAKRAATSVESDEVEKAELAPATVSASRSRGLTVPAGGKTTTLPTMSHENPTRSRGSSPLGRYLAVAGCR